MNIYTIFLLYKILLNRISYISLYIYFYIYYRGNKGHNMAYIGIDILIKIAQVQTFENLNFF